MNLYTSYYANFASIPTTYMCIGISRFCPEGFLNEDGSPKYPNFFFPHNSFIAPSSELLKDIKNNLIDEEGYKKRYVSELFDKFDKLINPETNCPYDDLKEWLDVLQENFKAYDAIVFLCYEKPSDFCHRHIFRKILNNFYHVPCFELEINKPHDDSKKENYCLF